MQNLQKFFKIYDEKVKAFFNKNFINKDINKSIEGGSRELIKELLILQIKIMLFNDCLNFIKDDEFLYLKIKDINKFENISRIIKAIKSKNDNLLNYLVKYIDVLKF